MVHPGKRRKKTERVVQEREEIEGGPRKRRKGGKVVHPGKRRKKGQGDPRKRKRKGGG